MRSRLLRFLAPLCLGVGAALVAPTGVAHAGVPASIAPPVAYDAPAGQLGAVEAPWVTCGGKGRVVPTVTWTLKYAASGITIATYRGTELTPLAIHQVRPGRYRTITKATCNDHTWSTTATLRVGQKTKAETVSPKEFAAIKDDMTPKQVKKAVKRAPSDCAVNDWDSSTTCTYDLMGLGQIATVTYIDGYVVSKEWNVEVV